MNQTTQHFTPEEIRNIQELIELMNQIVNRLKSDGVDVEGLFDNEQEL